MGRDDDSADAPRRTPAPSTGNGSRAKRTQMQAPPPPGGLKYDPTMMAHHALPQHHQHHVYAAAAPDAHYTAYAPHAAADYLHAHQQQQQQYHQQQYQQQQYQPQQYQQPHHGVVYAEEPAEGPPPGSASNKRKRVKKERDDDWAPPPPAPMGYASASGGDMPHHMAMPTILHRSSSSSSNAAAAATTAAPHTVFNEAPVVIESFAETERRRAAAAAAGASASASASGGVDLTQLVHPDQTASATSSPKSSSNGGASAWNSRAVSSGTMSVYDVFFPATSRTKDIGGSSSSRNGVRDSKRRRRNNGEATDRSSTRSSNRRSAVVPDDTAEVDMLRFTVDAFKLIPQGLVDRIDARLRPRAVAALIVSHVDNWIKRAGFDDQNFVQEITTLLNVYYPCTHAMILDEVLVAFVFKRPELMEKMLQSIVERLQKSGESMNPLKYPVVESFAKRCGLAQQGGILKSDTARHDLACLTVLRLLLERNTEKFMLSPWIASCASFCSNEVLDLMWEALLQPLVSSGKSAAGAWNVRDQLDQVFELLREEKQLSRYGDGNPCKLSMTLIKKIVLHDTYADLRSAPVTCEAFEIFFGRSTNSTPLINFWLASEERGKVTREDAMRKVVSLTVENCARLSVKKTNWFVRHLLGFIMTTSASSIIEELVLTHAGLLLGGVDKSEIDELQASESSGSNGNGDENGNDKSKVVVVGKVTGNEKNAEAGVVIQIRSFIDALRAAPGATAESVVQVWSDKWCSSEVVVPWSYVWGVVANSITVNPSDGVATCSVVLSFKAFASVLVKHYFSGLVAREDAMKYLPRIIRILKFAIQYLPSEDSVNLLQRVLEVVSAVPKNSPLAEKTYNIVATTLAEQTSTNGATTSPPAKTNKSDRIPQQRAALLHALEGFIARQDAVGRFVRDQLLRCRRLDKVILHLFRDGDDAEASAAVKIMNTVVGSRTSERGAPGPLDLWTSSAIETVVALGYRVRVPTTRRDAIALLNTISLSDDGVCTTSLLWAVLKLCTNYCCGCSVQPGAVRVVDSNQQLPEAAVAFADLTKFVLKRVPHAAMTDVGDFIHQHIRSCGSNKAQWNLFLVLVLDRVVQLGWSFLAAAPKLIHIVLSPFDAVQQSDDAEDRIVQLRALKSLCIVLVTESARSRPSSKQPTWLPVARILASDQLASKLKSIRSQSACSTSTALLHSIALLCEDIKQNIGATNPPRAAMQSTIAV